MRSIRGFVAVGVLACLVSACGATGGSTGDRSPKSPTVSIPVAPDAATSAVIARYQSRIPQLMAEQDVPGLSVAVVDGDRVLWAQGFGYIDRGHSAPVTLDTVFSVQSMSKLFTSTAVMRAVQAGLVDLDVPITRYLPDFTVHSAFEEHPEKKITLRMLLGHTAGFTHEAPVGNNNELDPGSFDEHVKSISDTWLRFPVCSGYAYSNLGIDLAGYILEQVYGKPFAQVMTDTVLAPVGMDHSTFDRARIHATLDRATGYTGLGIPSPTMDVGMMGAGGLYSSVSDLARFLSFEINGGTIDGRPVLDPALIEQQRTIPAPYAGARSGYALGIVRMPWRAERFQDLFNHNGGGYGFLSDLWWAPASKLGIAILTNSSEHKLQDDLAISILRDLADAPGGVFQQRIAALPYQSDSVDLSTSFIPPVAMAELIARTGMPSSSEQPARWARFVGTYQIPTMGLINPIAPPARFEVSDGVPYFAVSDAGRDVVRHVMTEFQPGLLMAENGDVLDLRDTAHPTWRNLDLVPATGGPAAWQWILLATAGAVAVLWFAGGLWVWRRRRGASGGLASGGLVSDARRWQRALRVLGSLTALLVLGAIGLLAVLPGLVDSGFLGALQVPPALRLALHIPLALTVAAACLTVVAGAGVARRRLDLRSQWRAAALTVAAVLLAGQLAAWNLVGWGLS